MAAVAAFLIPEPSFPHQLAFIRSRKQKDGDNSLKREKMACSGADNRKRVYAAIFDLVFFFSIHGRGCEELVLRTRKIYNVVVVVVGGRPVVGKKRFSRAVVVVVGVVGGAGEKKSSVCSGAKKTGCRALKKSCSRKINFFRDQVPFATANSRKN